MVRTLLACLCLVACPFSSPAQEPNSIFVTSPDGRITLELSAPGGALNYQVRVAGQPALEPSSLGIRSNDQELGQGVSLGSPERRTVREQYRFWGAHATATNSASEATIPAHAHGETYMVDLHVANDGVAVRLRLPALPGRRVQADRSTWALAGDPVMWVDKLDASYESPYHTTSLSRLGQDLLGFPLTARLADGTYVTLTEAAVRDYGDLAAKPGTDHALHGELYADPQGWSTNEAVNQPWRVMVIARDLNELVNTTLVQNLNPAPGREMAQAAWVRPGRSSWQWLSSGDPVEGEQSQWVDWTSQLGLDYYLIDEGWEHWHDPWSTLAKVVAYARSKNVRIWIWVHSRQVADAAARESYFQQAMQAGVVGVKIDFPPPSKREVSDWYYDTAAAAAERHLMVDFHGATKPTGMERTWPNVLTREGVRGHEWHITRYHRILEPDHDVILPFTRYIAGPGDYTPTVFTPSELQGNTWAHEVAQSIVFTSPFLCFGGSPASYLDNPARDVLTAVPPVWDETRVLAGSEPGKLVAEARRSGKQWFVAVINGGQSSTLTIPLDFLGPGAWKSTLLRDASSGKPDAFDRKNSSLRSTAQIKLDLQPRGGFVGWIRPDSPAK